MACRSGDVWSINEVNQLPKPFVELMQVHSAKSASSLIFAALIIYSVHVARLTSTERKRRHRFVLGCTLIETLPAGIAKLGVEDGDLEVGASVSLSRLTLLGVVHVE